jgi:uncharacterized LabA/DUF88 family protein
MLTHIYVDGAFLRDRCGVAIQRVFEDEPELNATLMRSALGGNRLFYYDCVEDTPRQGEDQTTFENRTHRQRKFIDSVAHSPLCHVRLGTLKEQRRGRRITQKEVDVKIAVDMLTHAANKIISSAILVTGDLDFRPVVESLVQLGIVVEVVYDPLVTADELIQAADLSRPISIGDWYGFSSATFQRKHHLPERSMGKALDRPEVTRSGCLIKRGTVGEHSAELWDVDGGKAFIVELADYDADGRALLIRSKDLDFLLDRYLPFAEGPVKLSEP